MPKLLLILSLISVAVGGDVIITQELTSLTTKECQTIIEDKAHRFTASDILENRYRNNYFKDRTTATKSIFWTKVLVRSSSPKAMRIIFQNSRAGIDKIDVFIYKDKALMATHHLGDLRAANLRATIAPKSVFYLDLPAHEAYVIVSRLESLGPMNLSWHIYNDKTFARKSSLEFIFNGLFAGVLIVLAIYNFMLFLSLKEMIFLLYTFLSSAMLWTQYTYSGMFYFLDLGINQTFLSISAWTVPFLYAGLFMLFVIAFFNIHQKNRYIFYTFIGFASVGFLLSLLSLSLFFDPSWAVYTPYGYIYFYLSLFVVFVYACYAVIKGYPFAVYFILGEGAYLAVFLYSVLVVSGIMKISGGLQFLVPSAMLVEMILFSIALSKRVKLLKQSNEEQKTLLVEESKFSAIGKSIGSAAHQWKRPLSQLNTHLLYLEGLYYIGDEKKLLEEFGEGIEKIGHIINYMKDSIEELHDFYSDVQTSSTFRLHKQIMLAVTLQNDKLILNNIAVRVACDDALEAVGAKHAFANILMILFDNSIDQIIRQKIQNPFIEIQVSTADKAAKITFRDNAGGIATQPAEKIFDMHFSTKGSEGCGIGLALAQKLAATGLSTNIEVKNTAAGAEFSMMIPQ